MELHMCLNPCIVMAQKIVLKTVHIVFLWKMLIVLLLHMLFVKVSGNISYRYIARVCQVTLLDTNIVMWHVGMEVASSSGIEFYV